MASKLSHGVRKYMRGEKARIRREVADPVEAERQIAELTERFAPREENVSA